MCEVVDAYSNARGRDDLLDTKIGTVFGLVGVANWTSDNFCTSIPGFTIVNMNVNVDNE